MEKIPDRKNMDLANIYIHFEVGLCIQDATMTICSPRRQEGKKARRQEGKKARRQEGKKARRQEGKKARRQEGNINRIGTRDSMLPFLVSHVFFIANDYMTCETY